MHIDKLGFVILCPERNFGGLKSTVRSIHGYFPDKAHLCVAGDDISKEELKEFGSTCKTIKAGSTYASLINVGVKESKPEWSLVVMAGLPLRFGSIRKYETFCTSTKQILYPVIDRQWTFDVASIHGLLLHRDAIEEVGEFSEDETDFQKVKLIWATNAMEKGYSFRAIVGVPR